MFPHARFLYVVQHPRAYGEIIVGMLREMSKAGPLATSHWLMQLACMPAMTEKGEAMTAGVEVDPQRPWYVLNRTICDFLDTVSEHQKTWIRAEALRTSPDVVLQKIIAWMNLDLIPERIEAMRHPERSPFSGLGPANACFGTDLFLPQPELALDSRDLYSLEGPLSWHSGRQTFALEVKQLAQKFGYS